MENQSDSSVPKKLKISNMQKVYQNPTLSSDADHPDHAEFNHRRAEYEISHSHSSPQHATKTTQAKNISVISPVVRSNQSSPTNFNILSELGYNKHGSGPFEESQSFANGHYEHEAAEDPNKIVHLLPDSKSELDPKYTLDLKNQDVRIDSSFSLRTDFSMEEGQDRQKRKTKPKESSKVTFDDSLNNDLYDPSISSIHPTKPESKKDKAKKQDFISVYSGRPLDGETDAPVLNRDASPANTQQQPEERKSTTLNIEYKPDKQEQAEDQYVHDLFFGVSDQQQTIDSEGRWSKLTEDQAARLFEQRKNNIYQGLKKLNKARSVNLGRLTPTQSSSKIKKPNDPKSEDRRSVSISENMTVNQTKLAELFVISADKKRASSTQSTKRKSVTPQKSRRTVVTESSAKKNEQSKNILSINLNTRSRSLSHDEGKPAENQSKQARAGNASLAEKTMIDEIYKQAKEDVKKRIANIEKKLIENGHMDASKVSSKENTARSHTSQGQGQNQNQSQTAQPQSLNQSQNQGHYQNQNLYSRQSLRPETPVQKDKRKQRIGFEAERILHRRGANNNKEFEIASPNHNQQVLKLDKSKIKQEDPAKKEPKVLSFKATPVKSKYGSPQSQATNKSTSFNAGTNEKVFAKTATNGFGVNVERDSFVQRERSPGGSINRRPQQVSQDPDTPKSYSSKRSDSRHLSTKVISPKRMANTPKKFSDVDNMTFMQRSNYSRTNESEKKTAMVVRPQNNQAAMDENVANFLRLEKNLKNHIAKESAKDNAEAAKRLPVSGFPIKARDEGIMTKEQKPVVTAQKKDEMRASRENYYSEKKNVGGTEVKHFVLRPQSIDKAAHRKNSPNVNLRTMERVNKVTADKPASNQKPFGRDTEPNFFSKALLTETTAKTNNVVQETKPPRSQSNQRAKPAPTVTSPGFERSPKTMARPVQPRFDSINDISAISIKSVSNMPRQTPTKMLNEPQQKMMNSTAPQGWFSPNTRQSTKTLKSETDEGDTPKSINLKNILKTKERNTNVRQPVVERKVQSHVAFKPEPEAPKENYIIATTAEDLEELLRENYQLLEIRNNQYVFVSP